MQNMWHGLSAELYNYAECNICRMVQRNKFNCKARAAQPPRKWRMFHRLEDAHFSFSFYFNLSLLKLPIVVLRTTSNEG